MKYKIFDYAWDVHYQYDMIMALQKDCDFYYCLNSKQQWNKNQRIVPENLRFVTHYQSLSFDLAILHIDQRIISQVSHERIIFDEFNECITDIPKIIINHGTPVFPELFSNLGYNLTENEMQRECIRIVKHLVGDNMVVVDSFTSAMDKEWGFGFPILYGIDPSDCLDLPKEPRAVTALPPLGLNTYYNRQCIYDVANELFKKFGYILAFTGLNVNFDNSNEGYKEYLGKSLIYLNTSFRTPVNRARTEALLSGCCVLQVEGAHDLERWAKPGENIVIVPNNPVEISRIIVDLIENRYKEAITIGQKGKKMAIRDFNPQRYRMDWLKLIKKITGKVL